MDVSVGRKTSSDLGRAHAGPAPAPGGLQSAPPVPVLPNVMHIPILAFLVKLKGH